MALDQKDFIEESLKANEEKAKGLSIADLTNTNSLVNKAPELPKREDPIPAEKPKFDVDGYPELTSLRTYHGEVADAVRGGGLSMIKVAAQEQSRKKPDQILEQEPKSESNMHMILAIGASFLFVLGIGAVIFAFITKSQPITVVQTPIKQDIISSDSNLVIDITNLSSREIQKNIEEHIKPSENGSSIIKISLTRQSAGITNGLSSTDLLSVLGANIPDILSRSLDQNNFMLGIWNGNNKAEPFLVLETTSQETAFPGMLEWEKTMAFDLEPIMGQDAIAPGNTFVDQTVLNHDSRALVNGAKTVFFYSVINGNIIIVAQSADAMSRILDKIRASAILN